MAERLAEGLYLVGGSDLSHEMDCLVYLLDLGDLVLIDCGAGPGWSRIRDGIRDVGHDPDAIHTLLLTHAHVDHIGAATAVVKASGCRVVAHDLDAGAIETGDPARTAASWYHLTLPSLRVDHRVTGDGEVLSFRGGSLQLVHIPGHTPGSLAALVEIGGQRVLFGQDVHGPFDAAFGSDVRAWRRSMETLLALEADVLCEGHFGVFRSRAAVRRFIEGQLRAHASR
jgi:glyoxylase-like metal-dependent hydrolase (beta-lactamase superfamily II)